MKSDAEAITETDKPGSLIGGVDIQRAGENDGLIGNHSDRMPVNPAEPDDHILRPVLLHFEEIVVIDDFLDDFDDVIGPFSFHRNDLQKFVIAAVQWIPGITNRRGFPVAAWQKGQKPPDLPETLLFRMGIEMGYAADKIMDPRPSQLLVADYLAGYVLNDVWAGKKHAADAFRHKNEIGNGRGIDSSPRTRAQNGRELGNDSGINGVAVEDAGISILSVDALLNASPAGVVDPDQGSSHFGSQVHDFYDFRGMSFSQGPAQNGEVLGKNEDLAALNGPVTRNDPVVGGLQLIHSEELAPMVDEHIGFHKALRVQQV